MPEAEKKAFDALLAEADAAPFSGWDFSWLQGRLQESPLEWDYLNLVHSQLSEDAPCLDQCTGGGEIFSHWNLKSAVAELEKEGFTTDKAGEPFGHLRFANVGALAYHLKAILWTVTGFDLHSD